MSVQIAPEHVCYVHCSFCNTILVVSVPSNSMFDILTVRCGNCTNLLSVDMGAVTQKLPLQGSQKHAQQVHNIGSHHDHNSVDCGGSSSKCNRRSPVLDSIQNDPHKTLPTPPPEKRQRVPSAYNRFIKEEIQRIKANNPDISHREAFSTAAKNWAHFPHIHFGLTHDNDKQHNEAIATHGNPEACGLY
ncbi:protein YABBY 2-like isoform X1 [Ananas comosus]|uniref:Protein YABBY 2-like isoform X1 n=2 Tax=Ananas comosus TaxID=4615 RepID=A0A6P5EX78_ANACO|nr:protein YABBY 2-like isoform X1 [Ananas comosus]XP_020085766.1 protein YABBY 2-like isoform X1 [Ananas comosus]XP_020085767.1 protein YABBY 2-like isoform X1 [Ananas comosus]CAD1828093.1 unnamed protein product [Ananas comosus var. bracteatus]